MILLVCENPLENAFVADWVAKHIPGMIGGGDFGLLPQTFGILDGQNQLVGGVVFHNFNPRYKSIEVSCASTSPKWLTRKVICAIFNYPFDQLQVGRVTAITPKRSAGVRRFIETFGFKREGVARKGFGTDDAIVYGMLENEWRDGPWVRQKVRARPPHLRSRATAGVALH